MPRSFAQVISRRAAYHVTIIIANIIITSIVIIIIIIIVVIRQIPGENEQKADRVGRGRQRPLPGINSIGPVYA